MSVTLEKSIISDKLTKSDEKAAQEPGAREAFSRQQPAWHLVLLGALTFPIYILYWVHRTLQALKQDASDEARVAAHPSLATFKKVNPLLRTIALSAPVLINMIPLLNPFIKSLIGISIELYVLITLFLGIAELVPNPQSFPRRHPLLACGALLGSLFAILTLSQLHSWLFLLSLLAAVPCGVAQHWLNQYWMATESSDLKVRTHFNGWEIVAIVLGGLLFGEVVIGSILGIQTR